MPIPDRIITVLDARTAVNEYTDWAYPLSLLRFGMPDFGWPIRQPFRVAADLMRKLERDHGTKLGPVVRAVPDRDRAYLVGRVVVPAGRDVLGLPVPVPPFEPGDPVMSLAKTTAAAGIAFALADRAELLADSDGRSRQAKQTRGEVSALRMFGTELAQTIPELGGLFIDHWRRESARRYGGPAKPPPPPVRHAILR